MSFTVKVVKIKHDFFTTPKENRDMKLQKTAYELSESQVTTPPEIVSLYWDLVSKHRKQLNHVLDMGAGDAIFSNSGQFKKYDGVEIDAKKIKPTQDPKRIQIFNRCAFEHPISNYDACIGNPPYVRHHDLERKWKFKIAKKIEEEMSIKLNLHCNLYLYFMCLGLLKSTSDGLVALVIPFEWVNRPSAAPIRNYIKEKKWNVTVYEFEKDIFSDVQTTASISVIDKSKSEGTWSFYSVDEKLKIKERTGVTESGKDILAYSSRGEVWARRGMSPGTQKVFTLTETERKAKGLRKYRDVIPCVTSMMGLPRSVKKLNDKTFEKYFLKTDKKCWLIKSTQKNISERLRKYLKNVPPEKRDTWTCRKQRPWYSYEKLSLPTFLLHSGFVKTGPKVLLNEIKAQAVGSVYGINTA